MTFFKKEKAEEMSIPEMGYAEASARVQPIRDQLAQITTDQAEAFAALEDHQCRSVLQGSSIDPAFRQRVTDLEDRKNALSHTLRSLEARLLAFAEAEADAERAEKRRVAEQRHAELRQKHQDACGRAVRSALAAGVAFTEVATLREQIRVHLLANGLPGRQPNSLPSTLPDLQDDWQLGQWIQDVCFMGYENSVPDDHPAKAGFMERERRRKTSVGGK